MKARIKLNAREKLQRVQAIAQDAANRGFQDGFNAGCQHILALVNEIITEPRFAGVGVALAARLSGAPSEYVKYQKEVGE